MIKRFVIALAFASAAVPTVVSAADKDIEVRLTQRIASIDVKHNGRDITIVRNQDPKNAINPTFARTSPKCPPFCIQRMEVAPGVEAIGELELIYYLELASTNHKAMIVDVRSKEWASQGTIPGSTNIHWHKLSPDHSKDADVDKILIERFGAKKKGKKLDFSKAKTLVLYCNGILCDQASFSLRVLLYKGYPAKKLLWYREGMQSWESLGLTTVKDPGK
ncbi:MAG: rhodanese-like domain-containing protein [Gammaproteobacteria bacterium]|nr:rhodanese-like domain-containing protein [Gammaproteobacteria bacterium]